jgi:hypothetical protein
MPDNSAHPTVPSFVPNTKPYRVLPVASLTAINVWNR